MMHDAAKIKLNTMKLMQKYGKTNLKMIAPSLLKAVFKFLNTFAESKFQRLNVIL